MNIAIVIVAFNKPKSLSRLFLSLSKLIGITDFDLFISLDGGYSSEVGNISKEFQNNFSNVTVINRPVNLGLKLHMIECFKIGLDYDSLIVLEDDLYISSNTLSYVKAVLNKYYFDTNLAGFSLYNPAFNETAYLPFNPIDDGCDAYFMKVPSSWGLFLTKSQLSGFIKYIESGDKDIVLLPPNVNRWSAKSWKKEFFKYMIKNDFYFLYPRISYTTNFADAGVHHKGCDVFQVKTLLDSKFDSYKFENFVDSHAIYDEYYEISLSTLKHYNPELRNFDFIVDLYGFKYISGNFDLKGLFLTRSEVKNCLYSFSSSLVPPESNVILGIDGNNLKVGHLPKVDFISRISLRIKLILKYHNFDLGLSFLSRLAGRH